MLTPVPHVSPLNVKEAKILVLDSCGERASMALFRGAEFCAEQVLAERTASTALLGAVRTMLAAESLTIGSLDGIGVVHGPGSFTGVRVGLALVKGLCEASGKPVAAVSRLAVLAHAARLDSGFALLSAGRDDVYVREISSGQGAREFMAGFPSIETMLAGATVAVASSALGERAGGCAKEITLVELAARHAVGPVHARFARGGDHIGSLDANYVRNEEGIYRRLGETRERAHAQP